MFTSSSPLRSSISFEELVPGFRSAEPFSHVVIDDFLRLDVAEAVAKEFPSFDGPLWNEYNNAIEVKKACNHWDRFPAVTYRLFTYLNSKSFIDEMSKLAGDPLFQDPGLHGGGWHSHATGGKLNMHLDYSIHPKTGLERRLNLIIYMQPGWKPEWGGALGLWNHDAEKRGPGELAVEIPCLFNRAVIFDTSQNSWHGLPNPVTCPPGKPRNSLAIYYLCEPRQSAAARGRALFALTANKRRTPRSLS